MLYTFENAKNRSLLAIAELNTQFDVTAAAQNLPQKAAQYQKADGLATIEAKRQVTTAQCKALDLLSLFDAYTQSLQRFSACMWAYSTAAEKALQQGLAAAAAFGSNTVQQEADKAAAAVYTAADKAADLRSRAATAHKAAALAKVAADKAAADADKAQSAADKAAQSADKADKAAAACIAIAEADKADAKAADKAQKAKDKAKTAAADKDDKAKAAAAAKKAAADKADKAKEAQSAADKAAQLFAEYAKGMNAAEAAALAYNDAAAEADKAKAAAKKAKADADKSAAAAIAATKKADAKTALEKALADLPQSKKAAEQKAAFPDMEMSAEKELALLNAAKDLFFIVGFTKKQALAALFNTDLPKEKRPTQSAAAAAVFATFTPYFIELVNVGKAQKEAMPSIISSGKNCGSMKNASRAALEKELVTLYKNAAQRVEYADAAKELEKAKAQRKENAEQNRIAAAEKAAAEAAKLQIIAKFIA